MLKNLTIRKAIQLSFSVIVFIPFINLIYWFLDEKLVKPHGKNLNDLCFNSSFFFGFSSATGLMIKADFPIKRWESYDGISTEDTNRRIFFHETSGRTNLSIIQCCAIESAAKHNPNRPIQLFLRPPKHCIANSFTGLDSYFKNLVWLEVLSQYPSVSVILLNEKKYFDGTPLENWYRRKEWRQSKFEMAHLSDYIRILTLHKGGGLYLDMDILTLQPYEGNMFTNFLVYGSDRKDHLSNGAMHLKKGHWLSDKLVRLLSKEYDPDSYIYNGPDAVTEVVNRVCGLVSDNLNSNQCSDIRILQDNLFYPVPSIISNILFQKNVNEKDLHILNNINKSYALHLWNSLSRMQEPLDIYSNQIVAILARENCPQTVARARDFSY